MQKKEGGGGGGGREKKIRDSLTFSFSPSRRGSPTEKEEKGGEKSTNLNRGSIAPSHFSWHAPIPMQRGIGIRKTSRGGRRERGKGGKKSRASKHLPFWVRFTYYPDPNEERKRKRKTSGFAMLRERLTSLAYHQSSARSIIAEYLRIPFSRRE